MEIRYQNGTMRLELGAFFPAADKKVKQLRRLADQSSRPEENRKQIELWMLREKAETEEYKKKCGQREYELEKEQTWLNQGTERYRRMGAEIKFLNSEIQKSKRYMEKLDKNLDLFGRKDKC